MTGVGGTGPGYSGFRSVFPYYVEGKKEEKTLPIRRQEEGKGETSYLKPDQQKRLDEWQAKLDGITGVRELRFAPDPQLAPIQMPSTESIKQVQAVAAPNLSGRAPVGSGDRGPVSQQVAGTTGRVNVGSGART